MNSKNSILLTENLSPADINGRTSPLFAPRRIHSCWAMILPAIEIYNESRITWTQAVVAKHGSCSGQAKGTFFLFSHHKTYTTRAVSLPVVTNVRRVSTVRWTANKKKKKKLLLNARWVEAAPASERDVNEKSHKAKINNSTTLFLMFFHKLNYETCGGTVVGRGRREGWQPWNVK